MHPVLIIRIRRSIQMSAETFIHLFIFSIYWWVVRPRCIVTDRMVWSVCPSVCMSVAVVSPAKTAEPIAMLFGWRLGWAQGDDAHWCHLTNTIELSTSAVMRPIVKLLWPLLERLLSDYHVELQQMPQLVKCVSFSVLTSDEISYYNCCLMHALVSY